MHSGSYLDLLSIKALPLGEIRQIYEQRGDAWLVHV